MSYTMKSVRNLDDETLAVEIEAAELELSELEPRIAELRVRRGKTADVRALYGNNLAIVERFHKIVARASLKLIG